MTITPDTASPGRESAGPSGRVLPFGIEEFQARAARVRALIEDRDLDALIVTGPENIYYLTGYSTPAYYSTQALILPREDPPMMFVYAPEVDNVRQGSWIDEFASYGPSQTPIAELATALKDRGLDKRRIGIETLSWFFPARRHEELRAALPFVALTATDGIIEQCRAIKSSAEVAYIRRASSLASNAMRAVARLVAPGVTENDLAAAVYADSLSNGGEFPGSPPYVSVGERVCKPHASWSGATIRSGDQVYVELSACVARYSGALMRTFCVEAELHPELVRLEEAISEGLSAVIAALRPGITSTAADAACRDVMREHGFQYPHETGYSIGVCYPPGWNETHVFNLKPGDSRLVQANMVLHLVPHTILPSVGTVGMSETILVREDGAEVLTDFPREMLRLG